MQKVSYERLFLFDTLYYYLCCTLIYYLNLITIGDYIGILLDGYEIIICLFHKLISIFFIILCVCVLCKGFISMFYLFR